MDRTDTPAKVASTDELGQLPEPSDPNRIGAQRVAFNAKDMHAYGRQERAAERDRWQAAVQLVLSQIDALPHDMRGYVTGYFALDDLL